MNNDIEKFISRIRLSCDQLKFIAVIAMIIDHSAFCLLHYYMSVHYMDIMPQTYTKLNNIYEVMRGIGRISFPIFCFFLVEGFYRTRNVKNHAIRLAIFAILSEIPFDLAHFHVALEWTHQNVMLTLFLGFLMLVLIRYIENIIGLSGYVRWICIICSIIAFADIAHLCNTDYDIRGILLIAALYLFKKVSNNLSLLSGAAILSYEKWAPVGFVFLLFYDESIKPKLKYFFYLFYPVHLLILYLISLIIYH